MEQPVSDVLIAARAWARAREVWRKLSDSKSAKPEAVRAAQEACVRASEKLYEAVVRFEQFLKRRSTKGTAGKRLPWGSIFRAVAAGASALEAAVQPGTHANNPTNVIDVEGYDVKGDETK